MLAVPFDAARLTPVGQPIAVLNLPAGVGGLPALAVSRTGALVYAPTSATGRFVWTSRDGVEQPLNETLHAYANPRISPDGRRIVVQSSGDLWVQDVARGTFTRLTSNDAQPVSYPVWTPDGQRVVFRTGNGMRVIAADGSGREEAIAATSLNDYPSSGSPDGKTLVFARLGSATTSADVYVVSLEPKAEPRALVSTPAYEGGPRFSPDGRWLTYVSNESGQMQIYVRPFPGPDRKWQVSTQGGTHPVWNGNGKELFYRVGNKMMAVEMAAGAEPTLSQPKQLFDLRYAFGANQSMADYDVSPDGRRFVMIKDESGANRLNVVLNWFDELTRRVPTPER
ncbi:MAG TPA: hypothetical protein VF395_05180 [Polyangiaceae bacterium]